MISFLRRVEEIEKRTRALGRPAGNLPRFPLRNPVVAMTGVGDCWDLMAVGKNASKRGAMGLTLMILKTIAVITILTPVVAMRDGLLQTTRTSCFPAIMSFGSSVADTGSESFISPSSYSAKNSPYGMTYFGKPSKRWSDGRLHIDFWALALQLPLLRPVLGSFHFQYANGANFAASGSTATVATVVSPMYLAVQIDQFKVFKRQKMALFSPDRREDEGSPSSIPDLDAYFTDSLYIIAIGGNDFNRFASMNLTVEEFAGRVPEISDAIVRGVEELYAEGARRILVEDVYPAGCLGSVVFSPGTFKDSIDSTGCLTTMNAMVQLHNVILKKKIADLAQRLPDASISVVETYSIRYDMMMNPRKYGFKEGIRVCCGFGGGQYNFQKNVMCSHSITVDGQVLTAKACDNVSEHVVWDGIHYTDAANRVVMKAILSGQHFSPPFQLVRGSCSLSPI